MGIKHKMCLKKHNDWLVGFFLVLPKSESLQILDHHLGPVEGAVCVGPVVRFSFALSTTGPNAHFIQDVLQLYLTAHF